jgi:hypothetical protein
MLTVLIALLACTPAPAPAPEPAPAPAEAPTAAEAPPMGKIGGVPILPHPTVVGGIANEAVEAGVAPLLPAITGCWEEQKAAAPELKGKVAIKFTITADGKVGEASTHSTSLRNEPTESCIAAKLAAATFPPLKSGRLAIVHYPFEFPPQ